MFVVRPLKGTRGRKMKIAIKSVNQWIMSPALLRTTAAATATATATAITAATATATGTATAAAAAAAAATATTTASYSYSNSCSNSDIYRCSYSYASRRKGATVCTRLMIL